MLVFILLVIIVALIYIIVASAYTDSEFERAGDLWYAASQTYDPDERRKIERQAKRAYLNARGLKEE